MTFVSAKGLMLSVRRGGGVFEYRLHARRRHLGTSDRTEFREGAHATRHTAVGATADVGAPRHRRFDAMRAWIRVGDYGRRKRCRRSRSLSPRLVCASVGFVDAG